MYVPLPIVGAVGRGFFAAVRRFPILFLAVCIVGIVVMCYLALGADAVKPGELLFLHIFGPIGIAFYGGLAVLWIIKRVRGEWNDFCDYCYSIFANM